MISAVVGGATGKLGKLVCDLISTSEDMRLAGAVVSENGGHVGKELYPGVFAVSPASLEDVLKDADVYIDLTSPDAAAGIIERVPPTKTNLVIGTTAIPRDVIDRTVKSAEAHGTSVLVSANFALGVNVFWKMCGIMAKYLPDYDIEVVEVHHDTKLDAPSGTTVETLRILEEATGIHKKVYGREGITGVREREIGVHSIRAGDVVGDHTVMFAKNMERLELTHKSISRETLARGCVASVRWIADKKDGKLHNMNEVLGL
jgi:4-hydroxy-tetrahydrodipicolinate reductase